MFRLSTGLVLLIVSLGADSADAQGRLLRQQVRGADRSCVYENRGPDRTRHPFREVEVGAGEPCPFHYRPPSPPQSPAIPAMATLARSIPADGRKACIYSYLGREYIRVIDPSLQCPVTPHFLSR